MEQSSQVNIHGNNYEVNINRSHNAQNGIDIGNGGNANHPREMTIDMCNNKLLNKFCWQRKWEKAPETDNLKALQGTIYGTSMYGLQVLLRIHTGMRFTK